MKKSTIEINMQNMKLSTSIIYSIKAISKKAVQLKLGE